METHETSLADALDDVLEGREHLADVLSRFAGSVDLRHCEGGLSHFLAEEDVRAREPAYAEMQEAVMRRLIASLRAGASAEALSRINFLGNEEPLSGDEKRRG